MATYEKRKAIADDSLCEKVVQYTSGYSYHDVHRLTKRFVMEAFHHEMKDDDYIEILRNFTPSSLVGFDVRSRFLFRVRCRAATLSARHWRVQRAERTVISFAICGSSEKGNASSH